MITTWIRTGSPQERPLQAGLKKKCLVLPQPPIPEGNPDQVVWESPGWLRSQRVYQNEFYHFFFLKRTKDGLLFSRVRNAFWSVLIKFSHKSEILRLLEIQN